MKELSGFPYCEVHFNKSGGLYTHDEGNQLIEFVTNSSINNHSEAAEEVETRSRPTDLFVISHGWNNDIAEARKLYDDFFACVRREIDKNRPAGLETRSFAILAIFWPSKKFAEEDQTPSGSAGLNMGANEEEEVQQQLEDLKGVFDHPNADAILLQAKSLITSLETDPNAATKFADLIRSLPRKEDLHADDASDQFFSIPADELIDTLSRPDLFTSESGERDGAAVFHSSEERTSEGGAAGFDLIGGVRAAARQVLNYTTYIQMKERAGTVGRNGVYELLRRIIDGREEKRLPKLKIHLIGHSFGGRLVTAAADGPKGMTPVWPNSMTLLQAAFSHNGFAHKFDGERDGFFRSVVTESKVAGPIIITHSLEDWAVGSAYPIASKFSGDDAANFGGPKSRFGGIGRNGAQNTTEADSTNMLGPVNCEYSFKPGKLYNLRADSIILHHNDIAKDAVAHALLCAIATT